MEHPALTGDTLGEQALFDAVEDAWYQRTKGELWLTEGVKFVGEKIIPATDVDEALVALVKTLAENMEENITSTASEQFDAAGNTIDLSEGIPVEEAARRIAQALEVLWYGN